MPAGRWCPRQFLLYVKWYVLLSAYSIKGTSWCRNNHNPQSYPAPRKRKICSACQTRRAECSRAVIFSLSISFLCALLAGYFSGPAAYFPPPLFVPLRYCYSTHNSTVRPRHRCLPPLCCCRRHPSPSAPPAAYCVTVAAIRLLPLPSPSLDRHRAAATPPAPLPPLHLNVALDLRNLAASPQHGLLPVV